MPQKKRNAYLITGGRFHDFACSSVFRAGIRVQRIDENVGIDRYRDFVSPRS